MTMDTIAAPTEPDAVRGRRWFLSSAGLTAAVLGASVMNPAAAQAAPKAKLKSVTKLVAITWRYNAKTRITTVTKAKKRKVQVKLVGAKVYERDGKGRWVQVPYVWKPKSKTLVYSRALHLTLMPKVKPKPKPATHGTPKPGTAPAVATLAGAAKAASPYIGTSMAWHLARRASYGPSPALLKDITALGPSRWLERQLAPASIPDTECDAMLALLSRAGTGMMPVGTQIRYVNNALVQSKLTGINDWQQRELVAKAHTVRAAWSNRQLLTVMEDFWGNHFNVPTFGTRVTASREHLAWTIRAGAFGKFSALLTAVTKHPAMLSNLNNRDSDKKQPNENLGRELLELHTVGVDSPYGEAGVLSSARILTGLSVSSDSEEFFFKDWKHWTGPVKVLGFSHANQYASGGQGVAESYLDYLAHHKDTARRVCRKLAIRFVSDAPSDAFVERLAGIYLGADTAIAPVLRALFSSPEFAASAGAKTHRPFERIIATLRILGMGPVLRSSDPAFDLLRGVNSLYGMSINAGNAPFGWAAPNGYPDVTAAWTSTAATLQSWNNRYAVVNGWYRDNFSGGDLAALLPHTVTPWGFPAGYTNGQLVQSVAVRLFGISMPAADLGAVCKFLNVDAAKPLQSRPGDEPGPVKWQLGSWVTLLLDSPYGLQR